MKISSWLNGILRRLGGSAICGACAGDVRPQDIAPDIHLAEVTKIMIDQGKDLSHLSDGYHTFADLYEHRYAIFISLCKEILYAAQDRGDDSDNCKVWRARLHSDRTMYDGWFVMGVGKRHGGQITYHLPDRLWDRTEFAQTLELAPEWDGHSPADVVQRLYNRG